jgi:hypothetical protein
MEAVSTFITKKKKDLPVQAQLQVQVPAPSEAIQGEEEDVLEDVDLEDFEVGADCMFKWKNNKDKGESPRTEEYGQGGRRGDEG